MGNKAHSHIIGIDEVGRGPLAGPVAVGVVKLNSVYVRDTNLLIRSLKSKVEWTRNFKDSKKLSAKAREAWVVKIDEAVAEGWLEYVVAFVSPGVIDKKGLSYAIRTALEKALDGLGNETSKLGETMVLLDGGLRAPAQYINQKTIIKGDEKELSIALASIVAKVFRDKKMVALSKKFPKYGFEKHKGYGTRAHYEAIKKHGITKHHRKSFLKGVVE